VTELRFLPADVLGLAPWIARVLAERPRPEQLPGMIVPATPVDFPVPRPSTDPFERETRAELSATLERALAPFEPHVAVLESARALRSPGTMLVVAGQQPALLGGPLYNAYKALHVVALARALQRAWECPVVPAFWNHSDDHDLAEVHHLWIQNPNLDLRKVSLAGMSSGRTPLSAIHFDEERHRLSALRELLRQNLWEGPEQEAALEIFLPRDGESFSGAFTRTLLRLFGHMGLLVVEPDWIRASSSHVLARLVTQDLEGALQRGTDAVRATGREAAIEPRDAALLFRLVDGKRHALRLADGVFRYDGESGSRSPAELAAEIIDAPQDWSSAALLRPVVQDLVLPVAAYVGGWGELAYYSQLLELRRLVGAPPTPFVPRLSATLLDAATRESLSKLELDVGDVLRARGQLAEGADDGPASPAAARLREVARNAAAELAGLRALVAEEDRGLGLHVQRTAEQIEGLVEKLATKLDRVRQNASGSGRRHVRRVANGLFPQGQPQERVRGALEFVARYGTAWIDELLAGLEPLPVEHLVVQLDS